MYRLVVNGVKQRDLGSSSACLDLADKEFSGNKNFCAIMDLSQGKKKGVGLRVMERFLGEWNYTSDTAFNNS